MESVYEGWNIQRSALSPWALSCKVENIEMVGLELDLIRCASSSYVQDLWRKVPLAQVIGQTQESELDLLPHM